MEPMAIPGVGEYVSFLALANDGSVSKLAHEGDNILDGWLNTGMAEPHVMASTTWNGVLDSIDNCTLVPNADQRDTDGDNYGNICDADLNQSGFVDAGDLGIFRSRYMSADPDADLNGDASVDAADLTIFRSLYRKPPGPSGYH